MKFYTKSEEKFLFISIILGIALIISLMKVYVTNYKLDEMTEIKTQCQCITVK